MSDLLSKSVLKKLNQYADVLKQIESLEKEIESLYRSIDKKQLQILFAKEALKNLDTTMIKEAVNTEAHYIKAIQAGNVDATKIILIKE